MSDSKIANAKVIIDTVYSSIAAAGNDGIPSGTLYALLMEYGFTLHMYETVIDVLKQVGKVTETNNVLYA